MRLHVLILAPALLVTSSAATVRAQEAAAPVQAVTQIADAPVPSDEAPDHSLSRLFKDLGGDLKRLPSRETALILGAAGAAAWGISPADERLTNKTKGSGYLDRFLELGDVMGNGGVQIGGAVVTYTAGRLFRSPRTAAFGSDLIRAQVISGVTTLGVKVAVDRTRPDGNPFSFPSGHTSTSFATAAVIHRHFGWKAAIPAYGGAAYVAISRLQENSHYPSDVIVGAAVGLVAGRTVTFRAGKNRFEVAPIASTRSVGIHVALVQY
jgi:hypothetical protein